jgi:ABC-type transport system involved in cytochrome bd biosynthesis fused ATPase/permease subunit
MPGGIFKMKNSPLILLAVPRVVPSIIMLQPGSGWFVSASLTIPEIFPVVPAYTKVDAKLITIRRQGTKIFLKRFFKRILS